MIISSANGIKLSVDIRIICGSRNYLKNETLSLAGAIIQSADRTITCISNNYLKKKNRLQNNLQIEELSADQSSILSFKLLTQLF